jgi:hypothetical protein
MFTSTAHKWQKRADLLDRLIAERQTPAENLGLTAAL